MSRRDRWAERPCIIRYYQFKDELNRLWGNREIVQPCHLVFHLSMPNSWSSSKREKKLGQPHQQKPDIDNLIKAFFDCLLVDDSHIYDVRGSKYWSNTGSIEVMDNI
ncbi:MAG TPA: RusA family crossover junction endodeoxyribonuclease [Coleofasciculaceae cyanobacterium]